MDQSGSQDGRFFYRADDGGARVWWAQEALWAKAFYYSPPVFVGLSLAFLIGCLVVSARRRAGWMRVRRAGLLILISLLLGPGLLVNAVFKNHWGRPRPNSLSEFGGKESYRPPFLKGVAGKGKSFPAGHPSVVFVYAAFLPLLRRRRPRLAWGVFIGSTVVGLGVGAGRMAAGAHFFSDVIWSALMTWGSVWFVYYFVVSRCSEAAPEQVVRDAKRIAWKPVFLGIGCSAAVVGVLAATPVRRQARFDWPTAQPTPTEIAIRAPGATVRVLRSSASEGSPMEIRQMLQGFGMPGNRLKVRTGADNLGHWHYEGQAKGIFTELENTLVVTISDAVAAGMTIKVGEAGAVWFECPELAAVVKTDVPGRLAEGASAY